MEKKWENVIWFVCGADEHHKLASENKDLALREQYTLGDMLSLYENIEE